MKNQAGGNRSRLALTRALPILIVTLLFGLLLAALAWRGIRRADDFSPQSQEFELFARNCEGSGLPAAAEFNRQSATHPVVIFRETAEGWTLDMAILPESEHPKGLAEVQLTACIGEPEVVTIPRCDVSAEDSAAPFITAPQLPISLVASRTGAIVHRDLLGLPATDCWPAANAVPGLPDNEAIWLAIEPFATGSSGR